MNKNQFYNRLSEDYHQLCLKHIHEFQKGMRLITSDDLYYVNNYPSFGFKPDEVCDFIVYGQAPLGWGTGFSLSDTIDLDEIFESMYCSNRYPEGSDHTPIDWVNVLWTNGTIDFFTSNNLELQEYYKDGIANGYRAYRSFFWNVIYKLISDYYKFDRSSRDWSRKLLWSNLYKIAPEDANPNEQEKIAQQTIGVQLIQKEIDEIKPKYVVVLTNDSWWKPFRDRLKTTPLIIPEGCPEIQSLESYGQTKIIVTSRPRFGNSDQFVRQILSLL